MIVILYLLFYRYS